ncbi:MAG: hypothetical protein ACKO13_10900 [Cytophagales bacterium]
MRVKFHQIKNPDILHLSGLVVTEVMLSCGQHAERLIAPSALYHLYIKNTNRPSIPVFNKVDGSFH